MKLKQAMFPQAGLVMSTCANSSMLQLQSHDSSLRAVGAPNLCVVPAAGSSDGGLALGAKHAYLLSHLNLKEIIFQDRLGTTIGKSTQKREMRFSQARKIACGSIWVGCTTGR